MWLSAKNNVLAFFLLGTVLPTVHAGIVLDEDTEPVGDGKPSVVTRTIVYPATQHDLKWEVIAGVRTPIILVPAAQPQQRYLQMPSPSLRGRQNHVLRARAYRLNH
ncbi:hypothetical protein [Azonexus sp.]|uniref:hypothetical protein n=1 Tax=Azonexus sp. TaxID=1872668 RepID=UPI0027B9E34D|nr:hypothetical protein [Azonexus sp.]